MNLAGPLNGYMIAHPQNAARLTMNFFTQGGYERNPITQLDNKRGNPPRTAGELMAEMKKQIYNPSYANERQYQDLSAVSRPRRHCSLGPRSSVSVHMRTMKYDPNSRSLTVSLGGENSLVFSNPSGKTVDVEITREGRDGERRSRKVTIQVYASDQWDSPSDR